MPSARTEEYLEAIFKLQEETNEPVSITRLAEHMGLSAASASEMVKRLSQSGTVDYSHSREISLTAEGEKQASQVVRRHRLSERLLTDVLGFGWENVHDEACKLEHAISPEVEERLAAKLGNPETCPHGHPIPKTDGSFDKALTRRLSEVGASEECVVVMVKEDDPELLRYLGQLGIKPGAVLQVVDTVPFGGVTKIKLGDEQEVVGRELADNVLVT